MTAPATTVVRVPERGRDSPWPWVCLAAIAVFGGHFLWIDSRPPSFAPIAGTGSTTPSPSPSAPTATAGLPYVIAITETPPPTATRKPWPTSTPMADCKPGKATPGVICRVPLPPIVPQTETPIPRCPIPPATPAPGTMCIWQKG